MFYEGSLREGIAEAVQRQKTVVCFVTDDQPEANTWESDFLVDPSLSPILRDEAMSFRLTAGTEEAGYLAAIFPIPKIPTLVLLKDGDLKGYISAGTEKEEFLERTLKAFGRKRTPPPEPVSESPTSERTAAEIIAAAISAASSPVIRAMSSRGASPPPYQVEETTPVVDTAGRQATPPPPTTETTNDTTTTEEPPAPIQTAISDSTRDALADRAAKKAAQERAAQEAIQETETLAAQQLAFAEENKRRQSQAQQEKARILKQIADQQAARKKSLSHKGSRGIIREASPPGTAPSIHKSAMAPNAALQVRMEDGTLIRSRFPRESTLGKDVRQWVKAERKARDLPDIPFCFKVIKTPNPNVVVEMSEEGRTLAEIGLLPSATLVLVQVEGAVTGTAGLGMLIALWTWFMGMLSMFLGIGARPTTGQPVESAVGSAVDDRRDDVDGLRRRTASSRVHGLGRDDERAQGDYQLYNGNSTNFEPRPDDEDE